MIWGEWQYLARNKFLIVVLTVIVLIPSIYREYEQISNYINGTKEKIESVAKAQNLTDR